MHDHLHHRCWSVSAYTPRAWRWPQAAPCLQVLTALTRKFNMADDVDLQALSGGVPAQCTGADLYGMCADAWLQALRRRIKELTASGRVAATSDEVHDLDDVEIEVRPVGADVHAWGGAMSHIPICPFGSDCVLALESSALLRNTL